MNPKETILPFTAEDRKKLRTSWIAVSLIFGSKTEGVAWSDALGWQSVNFIHFTNSRLYS